MARTTDNYSGFGRSDAKTFTIPSGADGSEVAALDLGRNYAFIVVKCADCSGIPATTTMTALAGYADNDTLCDVYEKDDPSTQWSGGNLPTSGTLAFLLVHAAMAQRLQFVLSQVTTDDVVFEVYGMEAGVAG